LGVCIFQDGQVKFLICTDVAARGIDVHGLPFGIIHNAGRLGHYNYFFNFPAVNFLSALKLLRFQAKF